MEVLTSSSNQPFERVKDFLATADEEIVIFAPYIKVPVFTNLVLGNFAAITIVSRLSANDIVTGASDIELFPYCQEIGAKLFFDNRIHLKAYIRDWESMIVGSSNVTGRGLATTDSYNFELNYVLSPIPASTTVYLRSILNGATLVTEELFRSFESHVDSLPAIELPVEPELPLGEEKRFLISSLPMSRSISDFYEIYRRNYTAHDSESLQCALHDAAIYNLPENLGAADFRSHVRNAFFFTPFITQLLKFIDERERYFGEVKVWIQDNCHDVPVPSRRSLTGNIQVLYSWIAELSDGKYRVDRPRHSERIFRVR